MTYAYKVSDAKELGRAIKAERDVIEITIDLRDGIVRIKAVGKIAWAIAIGAIGTAVAIWWFTRVVTPASPAGVFALVPLAGGATAAVTVLGVDATTLAITVGITAGGVGAVTSLRHGYNLVEKSGRYYLEKKVR